MNRQGTIGHSFSQTPLQEKKPTVYKNECTQLSLLKMSAPQETSIESPII